MKSADKMTKDEIESFIKNKTKPTKNREKVASERLAILGNNFTLDKFDEIEAGRLIESGLVNDKLNDFLSSEGHKDKKENIVMGAIKELSLDQTMEIGKFKDLLKALPPDFVKQRKNELVGIQSNLGTEIRSKKLTGRKSGMMADTIQRMKNILKMGYVPEGQKSVRTKFIDRQKAIGEVIRSTRVERVSQAVRSVYKKAKGGGLTR
jgi:hypothetical protein